MVSSLSIEEKQLRNYANKLTFSSINDTNGFFYFLGTGEGKGNNYENPIKSGKVEVTISSSGASGVWCLADRDIDSYPVENEYGKEQNPWLALKFRDYLFCLSDLVICQDNDHIMRNWRLEGKSLVNETRSWTLLSEYKNDSTLSEKSPPHACFKINCSQFYQEFRIYITGPGHQGKNNFSINQLEFYGCYRKM